MPWRCELTGKTRQIGHRVSHSNRKTKRRFLPNLLNVTLLSDALGRKVRLRISANALPERYEYPYFAGIRISRRRVRQDGKIRQARA